MRTQILDPDSDQSQLLKIANMRGKSDPNNCELFMKQLNPKDSASASNAILTILQIKQLNVLCKIQFASKDH